MKTKHLWLGISALLLAGGLWLGRATWRGHHQIVTLHVRNMPLAEVLRKIERQTWKKVYAEKTLEARITLNVVNKPLAYVLDRLAEQAGAQWSTLYSVYQSRHALSRLEVALNGDGKLESAGWAKLAPLEPAGWTKLAPELPQFDGPDKFGHLPQPNQGLEVKPLPPNSDPGVTTTATADEVIKGPITGKAAAQDHDAAMRGQPHMVRVVKRDSNDGLNEEEVWSPEELVAEMSLKSRLGNEPPPEDIGSAASAMAQKLGARWKTYIAFRKSALGIGFGSRPFRRFVRSGPGPQLNRTNSLNPQAEFPPPDFEEAARHQGNEQFERLTPEQRVRRARELSANVKTDSEHSYENK